MSLARCAAIAFAAAAAGLLAPSAADAAVELVTVGTFTSTPTYVTGAPGDASRLYVVERPGTIKVLRDGAPPRAFADLSALVSTQGERGLYSIAFAPDFATSRRLYAFYTATNGDLVIARLVARDADTGDAQAPEVVLRIPHDRQENHNGGQLQFGPDGLLYASTGDGGSRDNGGRNAENLTSRDPAVVGSVNHDPLLGKLLRLDVSPPTGYRAPASNAFGPPGTPPEIFAYGLRNPYRFSFDAVGGELLVGDVGQDLREEVSRLPAGAAAGANFGWSRWEGTRAGPEGSAPSPTGVTFPVLEYGHFGSGFGNGLGEGCSVTGGYVVRDPGLPELAGQYLYADYCVPGVRAATLTAAGATGDRRIDVAGLAPGAIISFGQDACDRVYIAVDDKAGGGTVQRLSSGGGCTLRGTTPAGPAQPGAPAAGPAAADRRAPVVRVRSTRAQRAIAFGRLRLAIGCDELCSLRARGQFLLGAARPRAKPAFALRARSIRLAADARVSLDLRPSARTRRTLARSLRRGRPVVARVELRATDAAGNVRTKVIRIRVRR